METAYNRILVEFDMLVDLDLAIFKYIKDKYNNPDYVDQNIIKMNDEKQIIQMMLNRQCINPLEILIPDEDVLDLLEEMSKKLYIWVELGLQTSNDETAKRINRGYMFGMLNLFRKSFYKWTDK